MASSIPSTCISSGSNVASSSRSERWFCPFCTSFASRNLKGVVRHIGRVHSCDAGFYIQCGIDGCHRTYTKFVSYKKHVYKVHIKPSSQDGNYDDNDDVDSNGNLDISNQGVESSGLGSAINELQLSSHNLAKKRSALFAMKLENEYKVSSVAVDSILEDVALLLEDTSESLRTKLAHTLASKGVQFDPEISSDFKCENPFAGLHTDYLRGKYYVEEMNLLEPVERVVGEEVLSSGHTKHFVYEIPLIASLEHFLSDQFIRDDVLRGHQRQDSLLGDYCDGAYYKSHPLFSKDSSALQVFIYYDDVEVCNPLGSRAKKHKLALFYYTLGNISPRFRSMMKSIQLLAITKSTTLQKYGPDIILESVMKEMRKLESDEGITIRLEDIEYNFKGTISVIPADNLASQYLGGYKSLASAFRKCRQCMAISDEIQTKFVADAFEPRTRLTHAAHCAALNGSLQDHFSTTYGLNRDSILNSSRYFHVTEGLVPDIMHDILEGVLPYGLKQLLKHLIENKVVTLSYINDSIRSFPYSHSDAANKPNIIESKTLRSNDHSLKQTASQMWCLARLLPLMIGSKVNQDSAHWNNYLDLLTIVDYCFAPLISLDWVAYLRALIENYLKDLKTLYGCRLIPKHHYMVHFPEMIYKYGPLVRLWCMRFEGKHNYFKDLAHRVKCFKNIPKTMATRHQQLMCYYKNSTTGSSPFYKETKTSHGQKTVINSLAYKDDLLTTFSLMDSFTEITSLTWIEVNGTIYKKGVVLVMDMELVPSFGILHDIIIVDNEFFFVCKVLSTVSFEGHLHSYLVTCENSFSIITQANLYDHTTLSVYSISNSFYIPLKYQLIENI